MPETSAPMIEEILQDWFRIQIPLPESPLKYLNSYVIRGRERHLVIDTGLNRKECLEAMEAGLGQLGLDLERTDFFITHLHADHFALASRLVREKGAVYLGGPDRAIAESQGNWKRIFSHASLNGFPEKELRAALQSHPALKYGSWGVPSLTTVNDGDTLEIGDYLLRCVTTPGHSRGHTCLYEPSKKVLVAGDHILVDITPNIQCWTSQDDPLRNYLLSLDKVCDLDVALVLPGHRRLFRDHGKRIQELKTHHQERADEVLAILRQGPMNAFQVAAEMTWDLQYSSWDLFPLMQKWFATGEAIAHLRYLEEKGLLVTTRREENIYYALTHA